MSAKKRKNSQYIWLVLWALIPLLPSYRCIVTLQLCRLMRG